MFPCVEPTECVEPLNWEDEHQFENHNECVEKNEERIGCHTKYFLIKVVLKAVSIDKKISTKESWHSKAEKKTFEINDNFGKQDETSKSSKPFEKFSVCQ